MTGLNFLQESRKLDVAAYSRNNQDLSMNDYDLQLLDLCMETKLRVLDAITCRDLKGHVAYVD